MSVCLSAAASSCFPRAVLFRLKGCSLAATVTVYADFHKEATASTGYSAAADVVCTVIIASTCRPVH